MVAHSVVGACVGVSVVMTPGALLEVWTLCSNGLPVPVVWKPGPLVVVCVCSPGWAVGVCLDTPAVVKEQT